MKFLVIQTAFIGDVILATPVVEKLRRFYPDAQIDFLLRQGNEHLLAGHPHLNRVWVWEKTKSKLRNLWVLICQLRRERYDWVINCQRFASSGLLTFLAGSRHTVGFRKNPFSPTFSLRIPHTFGTSEQPLHETERNLRLIEHLTDKSPQPPRLYPSAANTEKVRNLIAGTIRYVCIAPTSVWFTKQFPVHKWLELINRLPASCTVFLLGGSQDVQSCQHMAEIASHPDVRNLAGRLSFLESAALMGGADMNYVNDSAPMHIASAVNAPVAAVFCSTLPLFGFTPLSDIHFVIETKIILACRPCGLHGRRDCPQGHFACAETIEWNQFPIMK